MYLPSLPRPNTHELLSPKSLASIHFPRLENIVIVHYYNWYYNQVGKNLTIYQARTEHLLLIFIKYLRKKLLSRKKLYSFGVGGICFDNV